jgi:tetratricopeptide (TPR) repeat protein
MVPRMLRHALPSLLVALLAPACATVTPSLASVKPQDEARLAAAAVAFYRAESPAALRGAVAEAAEAGPGTALFHELAARLAQLEGDDAAAVRHLVAALKDPGNDAALLHLHLLTALDGTWADREAVRALLLALHDAHPDEAVRAVAKVHLAQLLGEEGEFAARDALLEEVPGRVPLAWVGTWDNDQGKGFDLELPPELRPGLGEVYEGRVAPLRWRRDVPLDGRGRYDLLQLMTPTRWAAAFAQGRLDAPAAGLYALHLTTSDPVKVWVDGKLVFAASQLQRSVVDQLVIPVELSPGPHRLLIKSAHREGPWHLGVRLTPFAGEPHKGELDVLLAARVPKATWKANPERAMAHLVAWAHLAAGGATTVRLADGAARRSPRSLVLRAWLVDALWFNQERGRTADLLGELDAEVGAALPLVRLRQARFHLQQGLKQKARTRLLELRASRPTAEGLALLAELWRGEGWTVDELAVLDERAARFGVGPDDELARSRALSRLGRRDEAVRLVDEVLAELPYHADALRRRAELAFDAAEYRAARARYLERLESWPVDYSTWLSLAEVQRRLGNPEGAARALRRAEALSPEASVPKQRLGDLAYEAGRVQEAVALWRRAVELNPENEALANRVDFLAPEARGPWLADAPDEDALDRIVRARGELAQAPGADVAYLLDHEVVLLNTDGSTSNVVTMVIHAWNAQGRDRIIRQTVGAGRLRVLHAYAVDETGVRSEASSERNRQIFFRGMQPGSTLVLQYRLDVPPKGYLSRYYTTSWSFQGAGDQRREATLVLWAPPSVKLHEHRVGELTHTRERRGELLRLTWSARDTKPLVSEPSMPPLMELGASLLLSTVPDWKTWLSWEQALLEGVFRDSPELDRVAKRLGKGEPDALEKLERIHTFVMEEIRYQQDYESFIAGVKPHPAPMTLERRYGDCKDKAVLFIELARKLGLEAHFALVKTRDTGPVRRDVPMQQFNHAIVYVPAQEGVSERFFDPTAELLDVGSVRSDDVGTLSLVFDPKTGTHTWREIPFQPPEANREQTTLALELDEKGGAKGTLTVEAVGRSGSLLRRTARNQLVFKQVAQRIASAHVPNASTSDVRALEVESLRVPAAIRMDVATGTFARAEGEVLRLKLPSDSNPRTLFALAKREHPLLLGTPQEQVMKLELQLPEGWAAQRLPQSGAVELPCFSLNRQVTQEGRVVKSTQRWRTTCERLSVEAYAAARARFDELVRLLEDELVLAPMPKSNGKKGQAAPKK